MAKLDKDWFELKDVRRRKFSKAVWVPIFGSITFETESVFPEIGHVEDFMTLGAAAIYEDFRDEAEKLDWHDWSEDQTAPYIDQQGNYRRAGEFPYGHSDVFGFRLVYGQYINSLHPRQTILNPDLVLAFGLLKEGNVWLRPASGYEEVVRERRDDSGKVTLIEIRTEYLRDFLAATKAALRLYFFRSRRAVLPASPQFDWPEDGVITDEPHDRCEVLCREITAQGSRPGETWAFYKAYRTDVDADEDVPDFSDRGDEGTASESTKGARGDKGDRFHVSGEMWRGEWIEPSAASMRMGYSEPDEDLFVIQDAGGEKVNLKTLNYEEVGKYLWFKPELINALLSNRGAQLEWYTGMTGGVSASPDGLLHFGVNRIGLINAYAYDVARLPLWERRIWVAHNCRPDGGVGAELLSAQMECVPADTKAPEALLPHAMKWLDGVFEQKFGHRLLRDHFEVDDLYERVHRFRATDEASLRSLAKDLTKLTIERIQKSSLKMVLPNADGSLGSLKLLQQLLAQYTDEEYAFKRMTPLYGIYDLRGSDAHLSASDIEESYKKLDLRRDEPMILQAASMIDCVTCTIGIIGGELNTHAPDQR